MKIFPATLFLFAFSICAFAQKTNAQMENDLVSVLNEMQKYGTYNSGYDEDKLEKAQSVFQEKLLEYTKNPNTLKYKFAVLEKEMIIATSDDGKFRIYSWDLEDSGTMHDFARVYQYLGADGKIYSRTDKISEDEEDGGGGSFVYAIYPINKKTNKIYVICTTSVGTTTDHYDAADLFKIKGNELIDKVKLFKTKSGITDSIGFEYDFYSVADWNGRPLKLIQFDKATQTIKIPVVIEDEKSPLGRVTNKFISYRFDGTYFVKVK